MSKKNIYIIIAVLVVVVAIAIFFYRKGKKTVTIQTLPNDLPGEPSGSGSAVGTSNNEIKLIANALYEDMSGFNYSGHDYEPYNRAIVLSDTDLVRLYNTFNTLYQTESKETLKQWILNENYYYSDVPNSLLARFAKLNLI